MTNANEFVWVPMGSVVVDGRMTKPPGGVRLDERCLQLAVAIARDFGDMSTLERVIPSWETVRLPNKTIFEGYYRAGVVRFTKIWHEYPSTPALSKEEFAEVVEVIRILAQWRAELVGPQGDKVESL